MTDREFARFVGGAADQAARETRAFRRGNVSDMTETGRLIVTLPNGAKIVRNQSVWAPISVGQSAMLLGPAQMPLASNPYGGGLGAPFVEP